MSKRLDDLSSATPASEAARRVVGKRLRSVIRKLSQANWSAEQPPGAVHQLRVATRRAGAALNTFRSCLPARRRKKVAKWLKRLRRAAGDVRDWDTFQANLNAERGATVSDRMRAIQFLLDQAARRRRKAQKALAECMGRFSAARFRRGRKRLLKGIASGQTGHALLRAITEGNGASRDASAASFLSLAKNALSELVHELRQAATGDLNDFEALHQLRITAKRLRYALEFFAPCFNPEDHEKLYGRLEEMQDLLGGINDSHRTLYQLDKIVALGNDPRKVVILIDTVLRDHTLALQEESQHQRNRRHQDFLTWWQAFQQDCFFDRIERGLLGSPSSPVRAETQAR